MPLGQIVWAAAGASLIHCWKYESPDRGEWHHVLAVGFWAICGSTATVCLAHAQSAADSNHAASEHHQRLLAEDTLGSTLTGRVQSDSGPIPGAVVTLLGTNDSTATNQDGRFAVGAPPGVYMVAVRRLGFRPERFTVTLVSGQTRDVTVTLTTFVPVLATITTTAEERSAYRTIGLDQRMQAGMGQYLTYDQIVAKNAGTFSQLLQNMRGIKLRQGQHQFGATAEGTRGPGSCVSYVVDGVAQTQLMDLQPSLGGPPISIGPESPDNMLDVSQVAAIEVYNSAARPAGFGTLEEHPQGGSGDQKTAIDLNAQQCTLVMVWTLGRLGLPSRQPGGSANRTTRPPEVSRGRAVFVPDAQCSPPLAADTVDLAIYATVEGSPAQPISDNAWAHYKDEVLLAIERSSALPSDLILPSFGIPMKLRRDADATGGPTVGVAPTLSGVLMFTLDATGAVTSAHVAASSLSAEGDTSMLAMVERAGNAHAFPRLPASLETDSAQLYLVVASIKPVPGARAAVLGQLEVPVWPLERPAQLAPGEQPNSAGRVGHGAARSDSMRVEVVVGAAGQAIQRTVRILDVAAISTGRASAQSEARLIEMLPQFRFEPAMIGACPVPQLVIQSFGLP